MKKLENDVMQFFHNQGYVIVSTVDNNGFPHNSCKGIVRISPQGRVYIIDLYKAKTYDNLKHNPHISITAIDEHKFIGYCLKGKGKVIVKEKLKSPIVKVWEARITGRLTRRLLRNIHDEKGHPRHPEILLPSPEYMIVMEIEEVIDLTPHHLK